MALQLSYIPKAATPLQARESSPLVAYPAPTEINDHDLNNSVVTWWHVRRSIQILSKSTPQRKQRPLHKADWAVTSHPSMSSSSGPTLWYSRLVFLHKARVAKRQTRGAQNAVGATPCEFDSHLGHEVPQQIAHGSRRARSGAETRLFPPLAPAPRAGWQARHALLQACLRPRGKAWGGSGVCWEHGAKL